MDKDGNAEGDLFYDDGDTIDTISPKSYYYATFKWSGSQRQLSFQVKENGYPKMSELRLDSLTIYGLENIPDALLVNNKQYPLQLRPFTQIAEVSGLGLPMNGNYLFNWNSTDSVTVEVEEIPSNDPKYRVDCFPDPSKSIDFSRET